jgi:tRNA threonylcarbamoyladenosine biosynthesis protein TsaB
VAGSAPALLALETATRAVGVALLRGGCVEAEQDAPADRPAAETLISAIDAVLARAGIAPRALDAVAVSIGPGSFTGLRVGLSTAKGLAFGRPCPLVPVSTLEALALAAGVGDDPVVAMLDARRGEVYAAAWAVSRDGPQALLAEGVYGAEQLARRLPSACRLVGDGAAVVGAELRARLGDGVRLAPEVRPLARCVGALGIRALAAGGGADAAGLVPRYLRRAQAEVRRAGAPRERRPAVP